MTKIITIFLFVALLQFEGYDPIFKLACNKDVCEYVVIDEEG